MLLGLAGVVPDADVERVLARIRPLADWFDRIFGETVFPMGPSPDAAVAVFVYQNNSRWQSALNRLAQTWQVTLGQASGTGLTLQEVAMSTLNVPAGVDRPVIFHEAVHAHVGAAAPGHNRQRQRVLVPRGRGQLHAAGHSPRVCPSGLVFDGFGNGSARFKNPAEVFGTRVDFSDYPMLASLVAYLIDNDTDLLRALAVGLRDDQATADILEAQGTSVEALTMAWRTWGQEKFASPSTPLIPVPLEWLE